MTPALEPRLRFETLSKGRGIWLADKHPHQRSCRWICWRYEKRNQKASSACKSCEADLVGTEAQSPSQRLRHLQSCGLSVREGERLVQLAGVREVRVGPSPIHRTASIPPADASKTGVHESMRGGLAATNGSAPATLDTWAVTTSSCSDQRATIPAASCHQPLIHSLIIPPWSHAT